MLMSYVFTSLDVVGRCYCQGCDDIYCLVTNVVVTITEVADINYYSANTLTGQ